VSSASIVVDRLRLLQAAAGRQPWWESAPSLSRSFGCIKRSYSGSALVKPSAVRSGDAEVSQAGQIRERFGSIDRPMAHWARPLVSRAEC
jgi:hypothetical protein